MVGLIFGIILGYKINHYINKIKNNGIKFKILGLPVVIGHVQKESTTQKKQPQKKNNVKELKVPKCATCNDEDMFMKGTKNLIPCPECKRNANKFKKVL